MMKGWIGLIESVVGRMSRAFVARFEPGTGNEWMGRNREGIYVGEGFTNMLGGSNEKVVTKGLRGP